MALRISVGAFLAAAAIPLVFALTVALNGATGCPAGCGLFEGPLRMLATVSYFGIFTATPALFLLGVVVLAVRAASRR